MATLLVRAREIITCDTTEPQVGVTFEKLGCIRNAAMLVVDGRVSEIGSDADVARGAPKSAEEIDVRDCVVVPGFIDAHSHPLFAGDREPDFAARTHDAQPSQGMLYTVERTREALTNPGVFYEHAVRPRLEAMLAHGTTTLETKTGYALTKEGELALLDLIAEHRDDASIPRLVSTFLGAHAVPPEFSTPDEYVAFLVAELLPKAREHGAVYADVFCESGFFEPAVAKRYLAAALERGLRLRAHCDEMTRSGAVAMATSLGVDAVDHCNCIDDAGVRAIAESAAVLVACPATIEFLELAQRAPVRAVLERGGTVALASDFNPGTSPCFNLQTVAYFGRRIFGMTGGEALFAVTRAAAHSLRRDAGVLRAGAAADFVALQIGGAREFGWQFGGNLAALVVKNGNAV